MTDPFGGDDFLANFDVDAAVANRHSQSQSHSPARQDPYGKPKSTPSPASSGRANPYGRAGYSSASSTRKENWGVGAVAASSPPPHRSRGITPSTFHKSPQGPSPTKKLRTGGTVSAAPSPPAVKATTIPPPVALDAPSSSLSGEEKSELEALRPALTRTLIRHFGHPSYRPGQLEALSALLRSSLSNGRFQDSKPPPPRDVAVFWSTGSGKSLCYQIPPLHTGKVAVVVSPLISLMQDQVSKLNGGAGGDVAVFLGSGQMDPMAESRALAGDYRLVYVTPEKLLMGSFLDRLAGLHTSTSYRHCLSGESGSNICLFAVDESHCVSEWGHDFRREYRQLGEGLRSHPVLGSIPILALTATAVPRVQDDIVRNLRMRNERRVKQSFDRENLVISVRRKPSSGGYRTAFKPLIDELVSSASGGKGKGKGKMGQGGQSTIVYCPTRGLVDEIAQFFSQAFADAGSSLKAEPYHADHALQHRSDAHTNFLVGRTAVIVATVAFGMGIDKPDTRRVVHWCSPKTVEEYYQQIGRAGRDGLRAEATMFADANDFERYRSDFYLGKLSGEARAATLKSVDALRGYAMDETKCRRAALLEFFGERPKFGERCGTCDTCRDRAEHGNDLERDFGPAGAWVVLRAVMCLNGDQPMTTIEAVLNGKTVDAWRYRRGVNTEDVAEELSNARKAIPGKKKPASYFKEMMAPLVQRGYLRQSSKSVNVPGSSFSRSFSVYGITCSGREAVLDQGPVLLPVPASVREIERIEEEKRLKTLSDLENAGVDLSQIPQNEIEEGDGEVLSALKRWHSYLDSLRRRGNEDRVNELDMLRERIEGWRSDMAQTYRMAPSAVLEEHLLVKIAYATASLGAGAKMDRNALLAAGVRSAGLDELVGTLAEWAEETKKPSADGAGAGGAEDAKVMILPTEPYQPTTKWKHAVYKPNRKTGVASWESSYDRFLAGEHPQTIAINPASGRAIQVNTVLIHILEGLVQGRPVPLGRLAAESTSSHPPNAAQWKQLEECEDLTDMDVTGDPATSGAGGERFRLADLLIPVMGNEFAGKDFKERTEEEQAKFTRWCQLCNWYMPLRRAGYAPRFG